MTFNKNFTDLKKMILKADAKKLEGQFAFQFCIEGDGEGTFYFELKDGALYVEPYNYNNCTATFKATAATFKALLGGKVSAADAIAKGDLKVEGTPFQSCADIFNTYMKKAPAKKETKAPAAKKAAKAPAKKEAKPAAKKEVKAPAKPVAKKEAPKTEIKAEVKAAPKAEVKAAPKAEVKAAAPKAEEKPVVKAEAKPVAKTASKAAKKTKKSSK